MTHTSFRRRFAVRLAAALTGALLAGPAALSPAPALARGAPESFADLAETLSPAVVNIATKQRLTGPGLDAAPQFPPGTPMDEFFKDFFGDKKGGEGPGSVQSLGSGFVIDPEGYIVTNNHVIEDADEIQINFPNGESAPADLVGRDAKTDLALLKLSEKPESPLAAVAFGDSDKLRVGDWVIAIGNPFGLGGSVTAGIVSARNRDIDVGPYDDFIQTDAAINKGNSGGPLFNVSGEVIGVNTAIYSPTGGSVGVGFATPAAIARNVIAQLREHGETRRGWIGVRIKTVTPEAAKAAGLDKPKGALIDEVSEGGPAKAAGLEAGDVVTAFNGRPVADARALPRAVAETPVDSTVDVVIHRKDGEKTLKLKVALLEEEKPETPAEKSAAKGKNAKDASKVLGMALAPLTPAVRKRLGIAEDVKGALITDVESAGPAAQKGLRADDVILEAAQAKVSSPEEVIERVEAAREDGRKSVLLLIRRGEDLRFIAVRFEPVEAPKK